MKYPKRFPAFLPAFLIAVLAAAGQEPFPVVTTVDEPEIASRPVSLDSQGKLLPWPFPDSVGDSYASHFMAQWTILQDQFERQRLPYYYCCFAIDATSSELIPDKNWANSTAYLRAMLEGFVERLYPYTGDRRALTYLEEFVDYEMENGLTPAGYKWARVPYPSANPGAKHYSGWSSHGEDYVEPHLIGEDGYAYVRLYEMSGEKKYLHAAVHFADELVRNYKSGDDLHSPWPVRCYARDGRVEGKGMGPYSANVLGPISLFDELIRLQQGDFAQYAKVREAAWQWLATYPLKNNVWVGYFEDVPPSMVNMNNVIPLELARYVLLHPEKDADWQAHARGLIEWVKTTPKWPKYRVHGALVTTEQGDGANFCCNKPNQCCDSHTARLAAVEALYFARTGDETYREEAMRSFNWVTYFQGLPARAHAPFSEQWWFTDEFADGPRRLMDAFWAVPEWAPAGESHLLGSTSAVARIAYQKGAVTYATFDRESTDVLKVDFEPNAVTAGGHPLPRRSDLIREGYVFDPSSGVLRIRHSRYANVRIEGTGGNSPLLYVSFDNPHRPAGSSLTGQYPQGVISWHASSNDASSNNASSNHASSITNSWKIHAAGGKFGTFNIVSEFALNQAAGEEIASFRLLGGRVFAGIDVYNAGAKAAEMSVQCGGGRQKAKQIAIKVKPGDLSRLRTGWKDACGPVTLRWTGGAEIRFDNLAYIPR